MCGYLFVYVIEYCNTVVYNQYESTILLFIKGGQIYDMLDEKTKIPLGSFPQKIHIISDDIQKPILLFLHGGPGVANRHSITKTHRDLLDRFTLVTWDQRGTGGSYKDVEVKTLTLERMTDDANELVLWLCKRFNKDKIFVIGGSWGSVLGSFLAYRYPSSVAAFVGFGQVVNGTRNEEISYDFAMKSAVKAGDTESVNILKSIGPPANGIYVGGLDGLMKQRKIMMKYNGYSPDSKNDSLFKSMVLPIVFSGEYSLVDIYGILNGYKLVLTTMWPSIAGLDIAKETGRFEVPYYIFDGRLDYNTPAVLVEEYFETIEAPIKELIWFENSGHNPMNDEPELFKNTLREKLSDIAIDLKEKGIRV